MKKLSLFIVLYLLLIITLYFSNFSVISTIEDKVSDFFIQKRVSLHPYKSDNVVIIGIDEKSLKHLGQWPWSRNKIATIIDNLNTAEVAIIGLDITFGEKDGKSPSVILADDKRFTNLDDYDDLLSKAFLNSTTIEGLMMYFGDPNEPSRYNYDFKATTPFNQVDTSLLINAQGIISNLPILQDSGYSSGFLNTLPDADSVIRYSPLVIANDNSILPAMSLEIARLIFDAKGISIDTGNNVVSGIKLNDVYIPTDDVGRFHINFKGDEKSYDYISAYDIYTNNFSKAKINSKVALIGATALGLSDNKATPLGIVPGVQIHANMIDNILLQDFIYKTNYVVLEILILMILTLLIISMSFMKKTIIGLSISIIVIISYTVMTYIYFIQTNTFTFLVLPVIVAIITLVIFFSYRLYLEQKEKNKISSLFSRKVSKEVMDNLIDNQSSMRVAHQKETSIFFSDIRGFTPISEKLTPIEVVNLLNDYMTPMVDIIDKNYGTVDKFIGDAIMAYWNAPLDLENHADYALKSAIEQIKHLRDIQKDIKEKYDVDLDIGIGINTGDVTVGEIGSIGRSDYTVIGDAVNLASRVESLNKGYKTNIIITEFTKEKLTDEYQIKFLDSVVVKGKSKAVKIYEVVA